MQQKKTAETRSETMKSIATRHVGFAMRKDHPMLTNISEKIIQYLSDGNIQKIIDGYTKKCPVTKISTDVPKVDLG